MSAAIATPEFKAIVKVIKQHQQGHISKLQLKSEAELELLEALREYMQKRAELDTQYSKSLDKLGKTFQARRFRKYLGPSIVPLAAPTMQASAGTPSTPSSSTLPSQIEMCETDLSPSIRDSNSSRDTYQALSSLLLESEHQARCRMQASERFGTEIVDVIKEFNKDKSVTTKRIKYQQEMWLSYEEIEKLKLLYEKSAREADLAQKKYEDAAKRPKSGLQALKNLVTGKDAEERIIKLKSKWKTRARQLNNSRNQYLLSLQGINAMQSHYYKDEMTSLMERIDGDFYTTFTNMLSQFTHIESFISTSLKESSENVDKKISKINRQRDIEIFLKEYHQIFNEQAPFSFDAALTDESREITVDESSKTPLGERLGELISRDESLSLSQTQREKELSGLVQMAETYAATPQFGNAATPLEQKLDIKNAIALIKAQRIRINVQIQTLKELGVVPITPVASEEIPALPVSNNKSSPVTVIADFISIKPDEVSIFLGDAIEIVSPDTDGRTKVRVVASNTTGFVPTANISIKSSESSAQLLTDSSLAGMVVYALEDYEATDEGELCFKTGDAIECTDGIFEDEEWWDGRVLRTNQTGTFQVKLTKGWETVAATTASKEKLMRRTSARRLTGHSIRPQAGDLSAGTEPKVLKARALYSYEATCDGELSIDAGEILLIKSKETGSDAWWEGEGKHGCGQFPVNYVQVIDSGNRTSDGTGLAKLGLVSEIAQVRALYDFVPTSPEELAFKSGDVITVTQSTDPDWWDGELNGLTGAFPASYVTSNVSDI
ncbi:hypothetical protein BASA50_001645 [Batrachochytrium salamandrivorans]|uniref:Uncharacterized protein n=1 Tax=Batrachochytrium salamandrivorans TaxID=1357716 RepID=A0ABQ8FNL6_9FUNG|nr:hypothetical protein BASA62_008895 [Batrachochytrium salamandrivorans]KAH6571767.1 hypothetical protein BASA60_007025 [Batrachochytrium salamandrivorans]KAH6579548.1 hypothetical protein BASA61_010181 [Batrachochytrium salamandrivorans]KAH6601375.1 hypothetical protein BASA50_001645 [Batrachochytrium salamandrivorans]KAH9250520.1 hypothetical protein BASA81_011696 [Batrachochytrium salamandrivorans]